jgi:phospholipase/carboxylesterase
MWSPQAPYLSSRTEDEDHRRGILRWRPAHADPGIEPRALGRGTSPFGLGASRDGLVLIPTSADEPRPLIVMFHGAGGSASQVMSMLAEQAERRCLLVLAPDSRGRTWDLIEHEYGPDVTFLDRALEVVLREHAVKVDRIALAGFSDGASYALSLGLINGNLIRDVLAFSPGFVAPTRMEDSPRLFISHGLEDNVLPVARCGRRVAEELRAGGYDVDYREFSGGHTVPAEMVDAALNRFLG